MLDFEFHAICVALDGEHPDFEVLRGQLKYLSPVERVREPGRYRVEFEWVGAGGSLLSGSGANISIGDACLLLNESDNEVFVEVSVLEGFVRWLELCGDYDFRAGFSIKRGCWLVEIADDKFEVVNAPSERDLKSAIGYIPMYR